ncbi:MAG: aspartate/glutamate racemase family protein, partial [Pseudarthrobacter sp.]
ERVAAADGVALGLGDHLDRLELEALGHVDGAAVVPEAVLLPLAVLELEEEPERAVEAIINQAMLAVSQDKAEVIVLGCGGMAGLDEQIRLRAGVPVVDGVASAVAIAESLVRMRLSTSKVRTYAAPRPKTVIGWPLNSTGVPAAL